MEWIKEPWPWYVAGPLISLIMFALLFAGRRFGMSSNLETACTLAGAGKISTYFKTNWKSRAWNLVVIAGAAIGGYLSSQFLSENTVDIDSSVVQKLRSYGITSGDEAYLPPELFAASNLSDPKIILILIVGGFLVGFGARYAGGCTSGHGISGISNLQTGSIVATLGFFLGGIVMVHLLFPIIF